MLTIDTLREHVKADAGDGDALLKLYADAALSAAERYTGRKLKPGEVTDRFWSPRSMAFKLSAKPSGPVTVRLYAGNYLLQQFVVNATDGVVALSAPGSCSIERVEANYRTGPCEAGGVVDADPMIELGVMKFVAHAIMNRGDEPSDWAADSGAAALWRAFRPINFG